MFDKEKKQKAIEALGAMCHHCGDNHSDECPLAKATVAANQIPTEQ